VGQTAADTSGASVKKNLRPESFFRRKDTAESKDEWFFDEDDF
jgi:hypothetical protein